MKSQKKKHCLIFNNFSTISQNIQCNPHLVIENFPIVPRGGKNCDLGDLNMTNKTNKIASFINRLGSVAFAMGQKCGIGDSINYFQNYVV
jgi:hypothetical protein